jgi:hypothetical protein
MNTLQANLALPGFKPEEPATRPARTITQHYSRNGAHLRGVSVRNGRLTGHDSGGTEHEVARTVDYDPDGTRHKCNSSCQHATGHHCECACGGRNHGRARMGGSRLFF